MFDHPDRRDPRRDLWQAVLLTTVEDALIGAPSMAGHPKVTRIRQIEEARRYLTRPSKDLTTVCTLAGLDPEAVIDAMRKRIADAPSPEELASSGRDSAKPKQPPNIPKPKRTPFRDQSFTINGETLTAAQWAERTGISVVTAQNRTNGLQWPVEVALTTPTGKGWQRANIPARKRNVLEIAPIQEKAKRYEHDGHNLTLAQWAERTGISVHTIRSRLGYGWSIADAVETPVRPRGKAA